MYNRAMETLKLKDILETLEANIPTLKDQYHIKSIGVFGSFIKDKQDQSSDLDVLISFSEVPGLFSFIELENKLSDILGVKVDLVMEDALKPGIAERILDEVVRIV